MYIEKNCIIPEWAKKYSDFFICGFTLPEAGNLSHTRESRKSGLTTYENRIRLMKEFNAGESSFFSPYQTHSDIVIEVDERLNNFGLYNKEETIEGDSCVTKKRNLFMVTTWADCTPVIILEFRAKIAATVHSGWKSTYKQIINKTIDKIVNMGGDRNFIKAAIGPSIKKCCYEVGNEFYGYFKDYPDSFEEREGRLFFDPSQTVYKQLIDSRVLYENIEFDKRCTYCSEKPDFFSYRRDPVNFEGQGTFVMLK